MTVEENWNLEFFIFTIYSCALGTFFIRNQLKPFPKGKMFGLKEIVLYNLAMNNLSQIKGEKIC